MRAPDRIEVSAGLVHLPEEFRKVARAANDAGLLGYRVKDVSYGIDTAPGRSVHSIFDIHVEVRIEYEADPEGCQS